MPSLSKMDYSCGREGGRRLGASSQLSFSHSVLTESQTRSRNFSGLYSHSALHRHKLTALDIGGSTRLLATKHPPSKGNAISTSKTTSIRKPRLFSMQTTPPTIHLSRPELPNFLSFVILVLPHLFSCLVSDCRDCFSRLSLYLL